MKTTTKNLIIYALILMVLTILFRYVMSLALANEIFYMPWPIGIVYGTIIFIIAWNFGKRIRLDLPILDLGFRMHFVTYLVCNIIGEAWFIFGFHSRFEHIRVIHITALAWGVGLLFHYISFRFARKDSIKGLKKSEIFD